MDKQMITPDEAAEKLGINRGQLIRLIKSGKIKAINVGAGKRVCFRIHQSEIEKFIENNHVKSNPNTKDQKTS